MKVWKQRKSRRERAKEIQEGNGQMKVLLTSCGLETEEIKHAFIKLFPKKASDTKALFIPTAAIDADAIQVLPKCMDDLLKCGIKKKNIFVYDLHTPMPLEKLKEFDVVYVCGGNTQYLLDRINENGFNRALLQYIEEEGIFLGVSAGSIIAAQNLDNNLGLLDCTLDVHCAHPGKTGLLDLWSTRHIRLGNRQAILITGKIQAAVIG